MARTRSDGEQGSPDEYSELPAESVAASRSPFRITRSRWVFWLMFGINLINYLDRLIAVAVSPTLKAEFHLSNREIGVLISAFLLIYTITALPLGVLADRFRAKARIVALGVGLWSLFSGLTAFATGFASLVVTRALVGVGEASYYPAGTALLSAYFPREARARVMGRWQAGQLVGVLLAFALSGALFSLISPSLAWRAAFLISAAPGLALGGLMWFVADPHATRVPATPAPSDGAADTPPSVGAEWRPRGLAEQVVMALSIPTIWVVIVLQAITFIAATPTITFLPIYISNPHGPFHLGAAHTAFLTGFIVVVGGVTGALLGGPLADRLARWHEGGRVLAVGVGMLIALPCYIVMLLTGNLAVFTVAGLLAVLAVNLSTGPLTAIPQDVAPPWLRATVVAVTLLLSHLLGDVWAPTAVGALSAMLHERVGPALLIVGAPALALGVIIALAGARLYARNLRAMPED